MTTSRPFLPLVSLLLSTAPFAPFAPADQRPSSAPADAQANDGLLTLRATVLMPDGSPAPGAVVESIGLPGDRPNVVRGDESGRLRLRDVFRAGAKIHARSLDGAHQTTLMTTAEEARSLFAVPIELTLAPAVTHEVVVLSEGRPVAAARVAATGSCFKVRGVTGPEGRVELRLPADERLRGLVAWHPSLGAAALQYPEDGPVQDAARLSLLAPAAHTIRVVDAQGDALSDIELGIHFCTEPGGDWILSGGIEEAHVRTDDKGEVTLPWAPRELEYVDVEIISSEWKTDDIDRERMGEGITTIRVRRRSETPVQGRIVIPGGASAEGILVTGFGFGSGGRGDRPFVRARKDGSFVFKPVPFHGYVLGIVDRDWASDLWTGLVLGGDPNAPASITIKAYPAIPLTIRVTRGANREPVPDAWVDLSRRGMVEWTDETGEKRRGNAGVGGWLRTDARGVARGSAAKGESEVRLSSGDWNEERTIEVKSGEPMEIEFHRPWLGKRRITATMTLDGTPYRSSPALVVRAWTERFPHADVIHEPEIRDEGTIEVAFDQETVSLLVVDPEKERSAFARLGPKDSSTELVMEPTATYSGTVVDENGKPLADRTVRLSTPSFLDVVEPQRTDGAGRFRFTGVPVNTPLRLAINNEPGLPEYFLFDNKRLFQPGETRENDVVRTPRRDSPAGTERAARPLSERVASVCRNAQVSGMRVLAVLQGDDSRNVAKLTGHVLDHDQIEAILRYLPLTVSAETVESEAAFLEEHAWPLPAEGEVVLIALVADKEMIAAKRISAGDVDAAVGIAAQFLKQHVPPHRDARDLLAEAEQKARDSGRRVWIVHGGPRCGPCFRLARWLDDHHATLEKDYVIVKVMGGIDENAVDVIEKLPVKEHGIPWHAILEPDGTVLTTSESPLGNIGMPSSVEELRHFRQMLKSTARRLSAGDVDQLIESLSLGR